VNVLHGKADLCEPVQNLSFFKKFLGSFAGADSFRKIAALCVLHDDFKFVLLGGIDLYKLDDERMSEISQDLCFFDGFFSLLLAHVVYADFFDDQILSSLFLFDEIGLTEGSFSQQLLFLVDVLFGLQNANFHCSTYNDQIKSNPSIAYIKVRQNSELS
jgi:hypothetical protein